MDLTSYKRLRCIESLDLYGDSKVPFNDFQKGNVYLQDSDGYIISSSGKLIGGLSYSTFNKTFEELQLNKEHDYIEGRKIPGLVDLDSNVEDSAKELFNILTDNV